LFHEQRRYLFCAGRCLLAAAAILVHAPVVSAQDGAGPGSPEPDAEQAPSPGVRSEFQFGSYGRVVTASDLRGGAGDQINVASYGPRLQESPYLELDFRYTLLTDDGARFMVHITPALVNAMFHYDGDFDGQIALRNMFLEVSGFGIDGLSAWAGSRMYRGDDIYLLNFWPMDNLNTVGAGMRYAINQDMSLAVQAGANQLNSPVQRQVIQVPRPTFGVEDQQFNDRLRPVASLRWEHLFDLSGDLGMKYVLWGELQHLGDGQYQDDNDVVLQTPAESGYAVGAQLGLWGFTESGFANVFFRHARGLAVSGELGIPATGLAQDRTFSNAALTRVGLSANAESRWFGVTAGAYVQWYSDADDVSYDTDDFSEGVVAIRPAVFVTDHFHQVFEVSYQQRRPDGLSARSDLYLQPSIWQFGVMPTLSLDRNMLSRPQLRLIYAASLLGDGALDLFPEDDLRRQDRVQHFLGIGAEWWFNSLSFGY
jgi:maltoporin